MKQIFSQFKAAFSRDRLYVTTCVFLLLTVASTFLGSVILNITVPLAGEIYPFRVLLPITTLLYLIWALKGNDHPWKDASTLEKWAYVLMGSMLIYGAISLLWAANFLFSFKKLFNLCFDLTFFFLILRLCRNKRILQTVIVIAMVGFFLVCVLGIYEVFHEGIFDDAYDNFHRAPWFLEYLQLPIVVSSNTNDYCATLVFLATVFLATRALGVFDKNNRIIKYSPLIIFPMLFFLLTIADARLNLLAFWILLIVTILHDLLSGFCKKRFYALIALVLCCITFCHQYRFLVPPIKIYVKQAKAYYSYQVALREYYLQYGSLNPDHSTAPPPPSMPDELTERPNLNLGNQGNGSLKEEFWGTDQDGNVVLSDTTSAGIRSHLLIHAANCFRESYGLGVGLGNTEVFAAQRGVIPKWSDKEANSIHCFLARILADYGIFVLVPLGAIIFLLLRKLWQILVAGYKSKNNSVIAKFMLLLGCCSIFPIASTASSDSQDILAMWLYLAVIILLCNRTSGTDIPKEEIPDA